MIVLQTERLRLRHMAPDDAAFILDLLNDRAFHRFIGDRGVRTLEAARDYILSASGAAPARPGLGFHVVELRETGAPVGICGLAKRDFLDDVDIGYAFLPQHGGQGYAIEAARGVLAHARALALDRLVATVHPENSASIRLLEKLGLRFERMIEVPDSARALHLFAIALS
jgi:ribosomal-protein-alanine N-acetyltransferase